MSADVKQLHDLDPLRGQLQDTLFEVIKEERFGRLSMSEVVGILEFLKWNVINLSN